MYHASAVACIVEAETLTLRQMSAKPIFTKEQHALIRAAAVRVWEAQFKGQSSPQRKMALALGVTQQTISNLLKGKYKPAIRVADEIATLDGHHSLDELIGPYGKDNGAHASGGSVAPMKDEPFSNLSVCIQFFAATKHWSPWTIAAARAGFFGTTDFPPPEWVAKLDSLEKTLERARKAGG